MQIDIVVLAQDPADPQRSRDAPLRRANDAAVETGGLVQVSVGADVDRRVAERLRREHRDSGERTVRVLDAGQVDSRGELGRVELVVAALAPEQFLDLEVEIGEVDALGADIAGVQAPGAVIDLTCISQGSCSFTAGDRLATEIGAFDVEQGVAEVGRVALATQHGSSPGCERTSESRVWQRECCCSHR